MPLYQENKSTDFTAYKYACRMSGKPFFVQQRPCLVFFRLLIFNGMCKSYSTLNSRFSLFFVDLFSIKIYLCAQRGKIELVVCGGEFLIHNLITGWVMKLKGILDFIIRKLSQYKRTPCDSEHQHFVAQFEVKQFSNVFLCIHSQCWNLEENTDFPDPQTALSELIPIHNPGGYIQSLTLKSYCQQTTESYYKTS